MTLHSTAGMMANRVFLWNCMLLLFVWVTDAHDITKVELRDILESYDMSNTPDDPTDVGLGLYMKDVVLDQAGLTVRWLMYLRMTWKDSRLSWDGLDRDYINLETNALHRIWLPDPFFRNAIDIQGLNQGQSQASLKVKKGGRLWMVRILEVTTRCPDMLKGGVYSGLDVNCPLFIESFAHNANQITFRWLPHPLDFDGAIFVQGYTLTNYTTSDCSTNFTTGAYSCLSAEFQLKQDPFIQAPRTALFLVSFLLVVISWLSFWLEGKKVAERIGLALGVTLLLMLLGVGGYLQTGSKLDIHVIVYLAGCIMFVLAAILEYAFAYGVFQWMPSKITGLRYKEADDDTSACDRLSRVIDVISGLVLFPALFIVFNIAFWMKFSASH